MDEDLLRELVDRGMSIKAIAKEMGKHRDTIFKRMKKLDLKSKYVHTLSDEDKMKISKSRRFWLTENPDKHPWKNPEKSKSVPCEKIKDFLISKGVQFVAEFSPEVEGRHFSVDIAFPDRRIIWEINGNQHYERDGTLKPYYQERHNLLVANNWTVYEIPYACCFKLEKIEEFLNLSLNSPVKITFDYFSYIPRRAKDKEICPNCDGNKSRNSKMCMACKREKDKKDGRKAVIKRPRSLKLYIRKPKIVKDQGEIKDQGKIKESLTKPVKNKVCPCCGKQKFWKSKLCRNCNGVLPKKKKIEWPSPEEMSRLVFEKPSSLLSKELGVSDSMITRFCKQNNIEKPPRGYWAKKAAEK